MRTIVLNRGNIEPDGENNKLTYKFPNSVLFRDSYIAVSQVNMFYSWVNISQEIGNNIISYTFWDGDIAPSPPNLITYTITIPDGLYEVASLNSLLQFTFIENGHYFIDSGGDNIYPLDIEVNPTRYAIQINTYSFPGTTGQPAGLPATYTAPSNSPYTGGALPTQSFNAQINLPPDINIFFGYIANFQSDANFNNATTQATLELTYSANYVEKDTATGTISYLSSTSPDVKPNSSVYLAVSNIDNIYAQPSSIIYSITPTVAIGGQIAEKPPQFAWNKLIEGTYNQLRLTFLGIDLNPVKILDPNMSILLVIKDRNEL